MTSLRIFLPAAALLFPAVLSLSAQSAGARSNGLYATIETSMGNITLELFEKEAPATVKNFTGLALGRVAYTDPRNGLPSMLPLFNGLTFHRVIPDFMIQGGDPLGDGTGGTQTIPDEIRQDLTFDRPGRLGMANSGPNTGSCQFFITVAEQPHLNGLHTVFGQVVEGQEVVKKITGMPTQNDRPLEPVTINAVKIARVGPGPDPNAPLPARPAVDFPIPSAAAAPAASAKPRTVAPAGPRPAIPQRKAVPSAGRK